jgi:mono/diheme cytochrome c family protein
MKTSKPLTAIVVLVAVGGAFWLGGRRATADQPARPTAREPVVLKTQSRPAAQAPLSPEQRVARGKHLVMTSGCHDCHTPMKLGANGPEPDWSRALSGHPESLKMPPAPPPAPPWTIAAAMTSTAWSGPWGVSFTANLTPDVETGTGSWTDEDFVKTIRTGRHLGRGRAILPPMPIPVYANFNDDDLRSIFAYLKSLAPIKNRVPAPIPPAKSATKQG